MGEGESVRSGVPLDEGGVSFPSRFLGRDCWDGRVCEGGGADFCSRFCFTIASGTDSCSGSSEMSSSTLGSSGGEEDNTHRLEEYFVLMKFSIFDSEGICDAGKEASQYLQINVYSRI